LDNKTRNSPISEKCPTTKKKERKEEEKWKVKKLVITRNRMYFLIAIK
jgi:hypothetical protein